MAEITSERHPMLRVLSNRDFLLLWIGATTSILGSQFTLIALPWLVLQLTGDPLTLGLVMALTGLPRAIFMLVGGVISDRFSPRVILVVCDWLNFLLTGLAAALVFTGMLQIWMLYIYSLLTGLLSGFVIPAANSVVPSLVPEEDLQAGNSISMGSSQLAGFVGPVLAGVIIGIYAESMMGIAVALGVDAVTFVFSAFLLGLIRGGRKQQASKDEDIWSSIRIGWNYLWGNSGLRFMFIVVAAINFLFVGPLLVGIPVLADQRLAEGARAFGLLMSAYSGGNLAGYILAGVLPRPKGKVFSAFVIGLFVMFGLVLAALGWITNTWMDFALMLILGIGNGYISLIMITWMQQKTPKDMLGRVMSMLMLASMGLVPLSQAVSGAIIKWNLTGLFMAAGGLILVMSGWAALQPALHSLSDEMVNGQKEPAIV